MFRRYARIWAALALNSFNTQIATALGSMGYLLGKLVRFSFFLIYITAIFRHVPALNGYSMPEVVLFFMTFNIVDVGAQFLFRGLYGVKALIEEGDFDKILTQPANPLFRIASMGVDLLDLLTLVPILAVTAWTVGRLPVAPGGAEIALYLLLLVNAMGLAFAAHVAVGALSVRTHELESAIWVYRDVMALGRFPVSIYNDMLRAVFVTVVPVGVMVSFPAQAMVGALSWGLALYAMGLTVLAGVSARAFWHASLREYTSISS